MKIEIRDDGVFDLGSRNLQTVRVTNVMVTEFKRTQTCAFELARKLTDMRAKLTYPVSVYIDDAPYATLIQSRQEMFAFCKGFHAASALLSFTQ